MSAHVEPPPPPRGRAHSRDWAKSTNAIVSEAKTHKGLSMRLRDETLATRKQTDKQTKEQQNHVDDMLRKKVHETTQLKAKLERRLAAHQGEIDKLTNSRNRADRMLHELARPHKKSETRTHLREKRPSRERIDDRVHRALETEQDELRKGIMMLQDFVSEADQRLNKMALCKAALKADHADKSHSLRLDVECLDLPARAAAQNQRDSTWGSGTSSPKIPGAGEGANAVTKSTQLPAIWKQNTERVVADAQKLENEAAELRRKIAGVMRQVAEVKEHHSSQVRDALNQKVKATQSLHLKLNQQLLEINSELDELEEHRQNTERALQAKAVPLNIVSDRLQIRRNRPPRESVRDMVEEALEQEHKQLVQSIEKLERKLAHIEQEMARLKRQAMNIESDLRDKTASINIDKRCQEMTTNSGQSTPSVPPSVRSESHRDTSQRKRQERAEMFRKGGARLVPKPPRTPMDLGVAARRQQPQPLPAPKY